MKILQIHQNLEGGGIEAMICHLSNEMVKTNDVTFCSIFEPKPSDVFYQKLLPEVKRISCHKVNRGFSIQEIFAICRIIRQGNYDVVHIHGFFYYFFLAILFNLLSHTRFFYTVHSDALMENSPWDLRVLWLKKLFFKCGFIHAITISKASQDSFTKLYNCKSRLIFNGIKKYETAWQTESLVAKYKFTEHTKVFVHAGRLDVPKNQMVLCKVFQTLIDEGHDVVLLIAGGICLASPEIYENLKPMFNNRIVYLGERNDIPQLMSECDAFCLPSIWEGLPVTLLEALSVECIPICSPVGGIVNVVKNGVNGILSSSSEEKDYLAAVSCFLAMTEPEKAEMKKNCLASFENYRIENTAKQYLDYFKQPKN